MKVAFAGAELRRRKSPREPRLEGLQVGRGIDPEGGRRDLDDDDRLPRLERPKLLEFLGLLQHARGGGGEPGEEISAIGVDPDVLEEPRRRFVNRLVAIPFAKVGDRGAAEVEGPAAVTDDRFDTRGISQSSGIADRGDRGRDRGVRVGGQLGENRFDDRRLDLRFVPLDVDEQVDVGRRRRRLGDAVGTAGAVDRGEQGRPPNDSTSAISFGSSTAHTTPSVTAARAAASWV